VGFKSITKFVGKVQVNIGNRSVLYIIVQLGDYLQYPITKLNDYWLTCLITFVVIKPWFSINDG
jgi:hypothetical protein